MRKVIVYAGKPKQARENWKENPAFTGIEIGRL